MAYVVTQACIGNKHTNCVDVCPVDAFREGPDMLYIDPKACIECNACLAECPERAIYPQSAVPEDMKPFIALNAEKALIYPVIKESIGHQPGNSAAAALQGHFAIIGSGPSGFYAAEELLKQMPLAQVDMFERLPTPFGLVRYGVAPDHPRIKSVTAGFERIADHSRLRYWGNVNIGTDISREELLQHYCGVIYATGGSSSKSLPIPGADLPNVISSSAFVGWYNGHPDHQALQVDLSHSTAVVIGMGNVALDIARMLVLPTQQLSTTDMADYALKQLHNSSVREVCLLARRGAAQAAFTPKELEQLMAIPDLELIVDPKSLTLDSATQALIDTPEFSETRQNLALLQQIANRKYPAPTGTTANPVKRIRFLFNHVPEAIEGVGNYSVTTSRGIINAGLVIHAIGYKGSPIGNVAFDHPQGVISNQHGRVENHQAILSDSEYAVGWIKRGASGVIGSNKQCAQESISALLDDLVIKSPNTKIPGEKNSTIETLLKQRNVEYVTFEDWRLLDQHEQALGQAQGRPRKKITDTTEMLAIIHSARAKKEEAEQTRARLPVKIHFRSCTLCEAMCGVKITHQGDQILSIEGDPDDPHSRGHICPKGYSLQDLHNDPDRLKTPLKKANGQWHPISWDDALDEVAENLVRIQSNHGHDAVAAYWGNPTSHNLGLLLATSKFRKALGSKNLFTAASLDQLPHQLTSYLMLGHGQVFTIPDIDNTEYMLMLGANPAASNGSLMSSGDVLKRLEGIRERGKLVLVDPRRNESAHYVSEHLFIRPTTDALFLIGIIQHIINNKLFHPDHLKPLLKGWDQLQTIFDGFDLHQISAHCGIPAKDIIRIAEEFSGAKRAICYGRMGISAQAFGTLNHWLINILNIITGNLDRPGGMMFTQPAVDLSIKPSTAGSYNHYQSRVRGLPEFNQELPTSAMAEEMLVPGDGQVRAFVCIAGNPVLSAPNGRQLDQALAGLDYMVSLDFYLNETSRHADIILPPTGPLEHEQYDLVFNLLAVRNVAKFAEPLFKPDDHTRSDWDIMQGLTQRIRHLKTGDNEAGKPPEATPEQVVDFGLQSGPYKLTLQELKQHPHGLDLGPMRPRLPEHLYTEDKMINLIPELMKEDMARLRHYYSEIKDSGSLTLIGRRDLRTNNSWMHNSQRLVKGKDRCTLLVHPNDAEHHGVKDRGRAKLISRVGEVEVDIALTEDIMPGVVSLPHGWGHDREGIALRVAQSSPGVSANDVTDDQFVDTASGNAALNGVAVRLVGI